MGSECDLKRKSGIRMEITIILLYVLYMYYILLYIIIYIIIIIYYYILLYIIIYYYILLYIIIYYYILLYIIIYYYILLYIIIYIYILLLCFCDDTKWFNFGVVCVDRLTGTSLDMDRLEWCHRH